MKIGKKMVGKKMGRGQRLAHHPLPQSSCQSSAAETALANFPTTNRAHIFANHVFAFSPVLNFLVRQSPPETGPATITQQNRR